MDYRGSYGAQAYRYVANHSMYSSLQCIFVHEPRLGRIQKACFWVTASKVLVKKHVCMHVDLVTKANGERGPIANHQVG